MTTGTGSKSGGEVSYKMSSCENRSFRPSVGRLCSTMQEKDELFALAVSHVSDGLFSKGKGPPWCQHRETGTWCPP